MQPVQHCQPLCSFNTAPAACGCLSTCTRTPCQLLACAWIKACKPASLTSLVPSRCLKVGMIKSKPASAAPLSCQIQLSTLQQCLPWPSVQRTRARIPEASSGPGSGAEPVESDEVDDGHIPAVHHTCGNICICGAQRPCTGCAHDDTTSTWAHDQRRSTRLRRSQNIVLHPQVRAFRGIERERTDDMLPAGR